MNNLTKISKLLFRQSSRLKFVLFLSIAVVTISCNDLTKEPEAVLISMDCHPCEGTCPVYNVTIFTTGKAIFTGMHYVSKTGKHEKKFEKEEVETLVKAFDDANFVNFKDEYPSPIIDAPSTDLSYSLFGKIKKIKNVRNGPKELIELKTLVEAYANSKDWKVVP